MRAPRCTRHPARSTSLAGGSRRTGMATVELPTAIRRTKATGEPEAAPTNPCPGADSRRADVATGAPLACHETVEAEPRSGSLTILLSPRILSVGYTNRRPRLPGWTAGLSARGDRTTFLPSGVPRSSSRALPRHRSVERRHDSNHRESRVRRTAGVPRRTRRSSAVRPVRAPRTPAGALGVLGRREAYELGTTPHTGERPAPQPCCHHYDGPACSPWSREAARRRVAEPNPTPQVTDRTRPVTLQVQDSASMLPSPHPHPTQRDTSEVHLWELTRTLE